MKPERFYDIKIIFCMNQIIMGGLEKVLCEYIKQLDLYPGITITVLSQTPVKDKYFLDFFASHNIRLIDDVFPKKHHVGFVTNWLFNRKLKKIFDNSDYIIDFANFSYSKYLDNIYKPKIGWCHGSSLFFDLIYRDHNFNQYDKIVFLTKSCCDDIKRKYPDLAPKITQIYNPIDYKNIQKTERKNKFSKPYFCAVQRLNTDKDVATIIKAFNIFSEQNPEVRLFIVGLRQSLTELAQCNTNIIFLGQQDEPYSIISGALALILSSTTQIGEGLANVLLEAHALKTLAVSSDVPSGPREVLMDGRAGVLFEPGNADELATVMLDVYKKRIDTKKLISNGYQNLDRFDSKSIVRKFFSMLGNSEIKSK